MLRVTCQFHVGNARDEFVEDEPQLHPREVGAEAEVRSATTERDVRVGRTRDVEPEWVVPYVFVAVGRDVPDHDLVAFSDRAPADLGVGGRRAAKVQRRAT